jgi:CMP/dCMP kinase
MRHLPCGGMPSHSKLFHHVSHRFLIVFIAQKFARCTVTLYTFSSNEYRWLPPTIGLAKKGRAAILEVFQKCQFLKPVLTNLMLNRTTRDSSKNTMRHRPPKSSRGSLQPRLFRPKLEQDNFPGVKLPSIRKLGRVGQQLKLERPDVVMLALDGAASSGKSSIGDAVAEEGGGLHIDSGKFYRAMAYIVMHSSLRELDQHLKDLRIPLQSHGVSGSHHFSIRFWWKGEDVTDKLLDTSVGALSARLAQLPMIRRRVNYLLYHFVNKCPEVQLFVLSGRDMSVVFPVKHRFYVLAGDTERVKRRRLQLFDRDKERKASSWSSLSVDERVHYEIKAREDITTRDQRDQVRLLRAREVADKLDTQREELSSPKKAAQYVLRLLKDDLAKTTVATAA